MPTMLWSKIIVSVIILVIVGFFTYKLAKDIHDFFS